MSNDDLHQLIGCIVGLTDERDNLRRLRRRRCERWARNLYTRRSLRCAPGEECSACAEVKEIRSSLDDVQVLLHHMQDQLDVEIPSYSYLPQAATWA